MADIQSNGGGRSKFASERTREVEENTNKTNLIINYLPQTISDEAFYKLFKAIGQVTNHKIVRDLETGYCYGYGFINYATPEEAAAAIEKLNGLKLLNKTLKVAYARPKSDKTKNCNLYLTGLPPDITESRLQDMFAPFGEVINIKILLNQNTMMCCGTGFVLLSNTDECEKAVTALEGTTPEGFSAPLVIKYAHSNISKKHQMGFVPPPGFVPKIKATSGGPMRNSKSQQHRMTPMGGKQQDSSGVVTDPTIAARNELGVILFIRNFPLDTDEEALYSIFTPFGVVRKVNIMRTEENKGRGFGFVTMANDQEAVRAVLKLNKSTYKGRTIEVRFKLQETPAADNPFGVDMQAAAASYFEGNAGAGFGGAQHWTQGYSSTPDSMKQQAMGMGMGGMGMGGMGMGGMGMGMGAMGMGNMENMGMANMGGMGMGGMGMGPMGNMMGMMGMGRQSGGMGQRGMEPRGMESRGMEPRGMDPRGMEPRGMDPRGMDPRAMEADQGDYDPDALPAPRRRYRRDLEEEEGYDYARPQPLVRRY